MARYERGIEKSLRKTLKFLDYGPALTRQMLIRVNTKMTVYINTFANGIIQIELKDASTDRIRIKAIWNDNHYKLQCSGHRRVLTDMGYLNENLSDYEMDYSLRDALTEACGPLWKSNRPYRQRNVLAKREFDDDTFMIY